MGPFSLGFFLGGIERSFLDTKEEQWVWSWKKEGRRYQMAKDGNHVGPLVSLKVTDAGGQTSPSLCRKEGEMAEVGMKWQICCVSWESSHTWRCRREEI